MDDNLRETFRIEPGSDLTARLVHAGRSTPCELRNLSAGGALVSSALELPDGAECELVIRSGPMVGPKGLTAMLPSRVLSSRALPSGDFELRLQAMTSEGSAEFEAAMKLVITEQRRQRARLTGAEDSSPMTSDPQRRRGLAARMRARFSKRSLRPGPHD